MKTKQPFVTVSRTPGMKNLHNFSVYLGKNKSEEKMLLQNCMEAMDQIFGRRAARRCAKLVFAL